MTTAGGTKPPGSDDQDEQMMHPASEDGWDDAPSAAPSQAVVVAPPVAPEAPVTATVTAVIPTPPSTTPTPSATPTPSGTETAAAEEPLIPATYSENDLRAAVGATPASTASSSRARYHDPDDPDDLTGARPRRTMISVAVVSLIGGVAILAMVVLGNANSDRYLLACEAERAVAQQGRSFPPWGTRALDGDAWRPVKITPETRCQPHETDDVLDLQRRYLAMLLEQANALLTAREVTKLDDAESLLKQAMLLTRPAGHEAAPKAAERSERHKDVERLLGDVTYWRAAAKLRDAATTLTDAAKQFDTATEQHPRHMSDAPAWANYARKLADDLRAGPVGASRALVPAPTPTSATAIPGTTPPTPTTAPPAPVTPERPAAPLGTALPVEPGKPGSPDEPSTSNPPTPPTSTPGPGVPAGGVLL